MLGALDLFPGLELFVLRGKVGIRKDMRMAADHLGGIVGQGVIQRKLALPFVQAGNKDQQKGHVAQFFAHVVVTAVADGTDQLVAFLDDVFCQALRGLGLVPRAAVVGDETVENVLQLLKSTFFHDTLSLRGTGAAARLEFEAGNKVRRQPGPYLFDK